MHARVCVGVCYRVHFRGPVMTHHTPYPPRALRCPVLCDVELRGRGPDRHLGLELRRVHDRLDHGHRHLGLQDGHGGRATHG